MQVLKGKLATAPDASGSNVSHAYVFFLIVKTQHFQIDLKVAHFTSFQQRKIISLIPSMFNQLLILKVLKVKYVGIFEVVKIKLIN